MWSHTPNAIFSSSSISPCLVISIVISNFKLPRFCSRRTGNRRLTNRSHRREGYRWERLYYLIGRMSMQMREGASDTSFFAETLEKQGFLHHAKLPQCSILADYTKIAVFVSKICIAFWLAARENGARTVFGECLKYWGRRQFVCSKTTLNTNPVWRFRFPAFPFPPTSYVTLIMLPTHSVPQSFFFFFLQN